MLNILLLLFSTEVFCKNISIKDSDDITKAELKNLTLSLVWSNNFTATVDLHVENEEYCIYSGQFTDDEDSDVLVTGCFDENENMDISVQTKSDIYGNHLFTITRNGTVKHVSAEAYNFEDELVIVDEEFLSPAPLDNGLL